MKNKSWISVIAAGALFSGMLFTEKVDAASMRASHNAYVYNAQAKRVGHKKIAKGQIVKTSGLKKIKGKYYWRIGRNQYVKKSNIAKSVRRKRDNQIYKPVVTKDVDINLDTHSGTPDPKSAIANANQMPVGTKFSWANDYKPEFKIDGETNGTVNITFPDGSKTSADVQYIYHGTDYIKLPKDYTLAGLKEAESNPTSEMQKAADEGSEMNHFISESAQDDKEKVDIHNLTADQKERISKFALNLINEARTQLGQPGWHYDDSTQSLADDVAAKYQKDKRGIQDGGHYVEGLVEVAAQHGYDLNGINQIEDMYGDTTNVPKTMTNLKRITYASVALFLFNPKEFHHAADILSGHASEDWNNSTMSNPFAVSFSRVGGWNSVHFISVPDGVRD